MFAARICCNEHVPASDSASQAAYAENPVIRDDVCVMIEFAILERVTLRTEILIFIQEFSYYCILLHAARKQAQTHEMALQRRKMARVMHIPKPYR